MIKAQLVKLAPLAKVIANESKLGGTKVRRKIFKNNDDSVEVIDVQIEILHTEELAKKLNLPAGITSTTVQATTGCLVIHMRKANGQWFWHPFGWRE